MLFTTENQPKRVINYPEMPHVHYFIARRMRKQIEVIKKRILEENDDVKLLVGGKTGSGKSMWAKQIAYAIDPTFCQEDICYTNIEFYAALERAQGKKGKVIIHDEAFRDFAGTNVITKSGKDLLNTILEMRQQNTCLILVTPEIDKLFSSLTKLELNGLAYIWKPNKRSGKERIYRFFGKKGAAIVMSIAKAKNNIITPLTNTPFIVRTHFKNQVPKSIDYAKYESKKSTDYFKRIGERKERAIKREAEE